MSRWSIRFRVVSAVVVGVVVALGVVFWYVQRDYRRDADQAASAALAMSRGTFSELKSRDVIMLKAVLDTLMSRADLRAALATSDRAELEQLSAPIFSRLKDRYGVTHLYLIGPSGRVILRAHRPTQYGDTITRQTFLESSATGSYGSGLELGQTAFALRVVHPVYAAVPTSESPGGTGKRLGYVEVGEEIGHFLGIMHAQVPDDEFALLIPKASTTHADWLAYRSGNHLTDNWNEQPFYVADASTAPSITTPVILDRPLDAIPSQGMRMPDRTSPAGDPESVGVFPVYDATGRPSGAVVAVHDMKGEVGTAAKTQLTLVFVVALATVLLAVSILWLLNRLVFDRLKLLAEDSGRVGDSGSLAGRDPMPPNAVADEIERFELNLADSRRELLVKSELLDSITDVVYVHDLDGRIFYANRAASVILGYSHEELLGMRIADLVPEQVRSKIPDNIARIVEQKRAIFESVDERKTGEQFPVEVHSQTTDIDGQVFVISVVRDLSERKRAEQTIERLAYFDPLTGTANRHLVQDRLGVAMAHVRRSGGSLALVFVDVDRLKPINDSLGHPSGDEVLRTVADRLSQLVRQADTVGRLGGDEFVLLLTDTDLEGARAVGERVIEVMTEPIGVAERELRVSVSAGIAVYSGGDEPWERLVQKADLAMYAAKEAGRNRVMLFDEEMVTTASERFSLHQELVTAFEAGELQVHYQPQVRIGDGRVVGAEALCRWFHPTRGAVPPDTFIGVAEESGLLLPMGRWVISQACRQLCEWRDAGLGDLSVAVNVSVSQIVNDDLVHVVREALESNRLEPRRLALEITESVALGGSAPVRESLRQLAQLGVGLVVDDFGVGYSALDSIAELPISAIKVDRSFVARMGDSSERSAIVQTVIDLGRHLGLETVAEGVETAEQLDLLGMMGCSTAQGFYFAPAIPAEELTAFAAGQAAPAEESGETP